MRYARPEIIKVVMKEFVARGLDKKYSKKIAEWQKYYKEQEFAVKLDKQMEEERKRFEKGLKKWTSKELEEFVIEGLDCLK